MLKLIKKYRKNPKRMVVTFSFGKRFALNRLGDFLCGNDSEKAEGFEGVGVPKVRTLSDDFCGGYVVENACFGGDEQERGCEFSGIESSQILENNECVNSFKEKAHIKSLDFQMLDHEDEQKASFLSGKRVRGVFVCEKSYKMLLCDLLAAIGAVVFLLHLVLKLKGIKR